MSERSDLLELRRRLIDGKFYEDYDEDLRLVGVFRKFLAACIGETAEEDRLDNADAAIAIGEDAFIAGFKAAAKFAEHNRGDELSASAAVACALAWEAYTPPEHIKAQS